MFTIVTSFNNELLFTKNTETICPHYALSPYELSMAAKKRG
jgi:hypothetical protein